MLNLDSLQFLCIYVHILCFLNSADEDNVNDDEHFRVRNETARNT